jgi:glucose/arabinose dehydrogenase
MRLPTLVLVVSALLFPAAPVHAQKQPVPSETDFRELKKAQGRQMKVLAEGLEHPWGMSWLPDGTLLITERPGRLRRFSDGKLQTAPVAGLPEIFAFRQGGLLDVSPHPDFAANNLVYLSYSTGNADANATVAVRAKYENGALSDVQQIFRASPDKRGGFHFGSRFLWLPDGSLLITLGDGGLFRDRAQFLDNHFGKIVRVKEDGATATGNPFHPRVDALPEIWSYGHRNIQAIARDPASGRIFATEHGARGGDELNLVAAGTNYGWPLATFSREYQGPKISDATNLPDMENALAVWTPCIGPSGLAFYTGDKFPAWRGNLFAGGLVGETVIRVMLDADGRVTGQEQLDIGHRVRDVRQGPDGFLYLLTDEEDGKLIRIEPRT